jgi:cytochrome c peroxidase
MKKTILTLSIVAIFVCSFVTYPEQTDYDSLYYYRLAQLETKLNDVLAVPAKSEGSDGTAQSRLIGSIHAARLQLKEVDFWLRYFDPIAYRLINGPLPVEWENEVFEKFEKPYRRVGAGLTLSELYLQEGNTVVDSVHALIRQSINALAVFRADSTTVNFRTYDHFFLANRLFLLNLAAIYTTGFECPDKERVIPELRQMLHAVKTIYTTHNSKFPQQKLSHEYLDLYAAAIDFVDKQPDDNALFDHFSFIKRFVNPLFAINQQAIVTYKVRSVSFNDYTLNNKCTSIFDKSLYKGQSTTGIFSMVQDTTLLAEVRHVGKLLFYDPILSANNQRSCASCHKPTEYFTDTTVATNLVFNRNGSLARNTPTLINAIYNHLLMLDGKHISLQEQGRGVITNPIEMNGDEKEVLRKIASCKLYKKSFQKFTRHTPEARALTFDHVVSALSLYYGDFSAYSSSFDDAMNGNRALSGKAIAGFNLFMGKAQCATCHFVPHFNGTRPPYVGSEFEVLGVPADTTYTRLDTDSGRFLINPAQETIHAFRTGTVRNAQFTKPYMHNGVFNTLEEVIDFYDGGGGRGRHLNVQNQTLSADSLHLTFEEKSALVIFIRSLSERIVFEPPPAELPVSGDPKFKMRKVGGEY